MAIPKLAMIPSGYKANKVYSVLPTDGSGDLDFARTTKATRVNQNGLIEEVAIGIPRLDYTDGGCPSLLLEPSSTNLITESEAFGNPYWTKSGASIEGDASTAGVELAVNGDFATDTDWNKNSNWTISGGAANADGTSNGNINQGADDTVIGATFLVTYDITSYTSGTFYPQYGGVALTPRSAVGTYAEQVTTISNLRLSFRGAFPLGSIDNLSVKQVSGFSAPSVDSPLGAFKLVEGSNNGQHWFYNSSSLSANTDYTISLFAKFNGRKNMAINIYNGSSSDYAYYDIQNGAILNTPSDAKATITPISNGWYRLTYTREALTTGANYRIALADNTPSESYQGDGTSGAYIFGAQIEEQSYATSYIKTSGTTISRTADSASKSGISSLINSSQGVVYAEISALSDNGTNRVFSISDGTNDNRIVFGYRSISKQFFARLEANNSSAVDLTFIMSDPREISKVAILWDSSFNYKMYSNGILQDSSTGSDSFIGLDRFEFSNPIGIENFYGNCKDLRVYNQILSDSELQILTTI